MIFMQRTVEVMIARPLGQNVASSPKNCGSKPKLGGMRSMISIGQSLRLGSELGLQVNISIARGIEEFRLRDRGKIPMTLGPNSTAKTGAKT